MEITRVGSQASGKGQADYFTGTPCIGSRRMTRVISSKRSTRNVKTIGWRQETDRRLFSEVG